MAPHNKRSSNTPKERVINCDITVANFAELIPMEYVYAGLLLHHVKKELNEDNLRKVLEASGIQVDDVRVKALVASLKEVNIDETIKAASTAAVSAAPSAAPPAGAAGAEKKEAKKEEKKEAASDEDVSAGLGALFG